MERIPFCPNPRCQYHLQAPSSRWWSAFGSYETKAFGPVPRFRCRACGKTFSDQTFSLDYYAKRRVDYRDLLGREASAESVRAMGRALGLSCGSILNRLDRLARQAVALHAELRPLAAAYEAVCVDGFVSFDVSQFFPSEIALSITSSSRFVLDLSHATRRRSGTMTPTQRRRAAELYPLVAFERGAIGRGFGEVLGSALAERPSERFRPFVLITDEKKEYADAVCRSRAFREQDEDHRLAHVRVSSRLPRTWSNPLFPSNYLDRELRKDQASHHRETVCFNRNVANGMSRLACYLVEHNYRKRFLIKSPAGDDRVHGEVAGIGRGRIEEGLAGLFRSRAFLSRVTLPETLKKIWLKSYPTPLKDKPNYLPAFALG